MGKIEEGGCNTTKNNGEQRVTNSVDGGMHHNIRGTYRHVGCTMVTRDDGNEWYIDVTSALGGTEIWGCQLGVKNSIYKMLDPGRMGALPLPSAIPSIYLPTGAARILRT